MISNHWIYDCHKYNSFDEEIGNFNYHLQFTKFSIIKLDLSHNKSQIYSVFVNMPFEVRMYRVTYNTISL